MKRLIYLIICALTFVCNNMTVQANDGVIVYHHSGDVTAAVIERVDSMHVSHYDLDSLYHQEYVVQDIFLPDTTYRILIADIDSIAFHTPEPEYRDDVTLLDFSQTNYIISSTDSTILFAADTPEAFLPKYKEVFVVKPDENVDASGFAGHLVSMEKTDEGIFCTFSAACIDDIFSSIILVGTAESETEAEDETSARARIYSKGTKHLRVPGYLSLTATIPDLGTVSGGFTNPQLTIDYFVCYNHKPLKDNVRVTAHFISKGDINMTLAKEYSSGKPHWTGSKDFKILANGIPVGGVGLSWGWFAEASGSINASTTIPFSIDVFKGFSYVEGEQFKNLSREDDFKMGKPEWQLQLDGTLYAGAAVKVFAYLLNQQVAALDLTAKFGPEVSASIPLIQQGTNINYMLYNELSKVEVSGGLKLEVQPHYKVALKTVKEFPVKLETKFRSTTRKLIPTIEEPEWKSLTNSHGTLSAKVSEDSFFPVQLGWLRYDDDYKLVGKDYLPDTYYNNKEWTNDGLSMDVKNLPAKYKYKAYPVLKLFDVLELRVPDYVEMENAKCPVYITDVSTTSTQHSENGFEYGGKKYEYKYDVSLTAKIEDLEGIADWGYVYQDPDGNIKRISLIEHGNSYIDKNYAYYRNDNPSVAVFYGYVQYEGESDYLDNEPKPYSLGLPSLCPDGNHPHAIDLGLPSGTKWSCCNLEAHTPEEIGAYYSWGEPHKKKNYWIFSYSHYKHADKTAQAGYINESDSYYDIGTDISGTKYDAAHVNWGGTWCMPTTDQITELKENCTYVQSERNGVKGFLFTGKNGSQIFLPPTGYLHNLPSNGNDFSNGYYWSSNSMSGANSNSYSIHVRATSIGYANNMRYYGMPIRAVCK